MLLALCLMLFTDVCKLDGKEVLFAKLTFVVDIFIVLDDDRVISVSDPAGYKMFVSPNGLGADLSSENRY